MHLIPRKSRCYSPGEVTSYVARQPHVEVIGFTRHGGITILLSFLKFITFSKEIKHDLNKKARLKYSFKEKWCRK